LDYIANMAKRRVLYCNSESKMYYIAKTYKMISDIDPPSLNSV
jgi:hypothetical protein